MSDVEAAGPVGRGAVYSRALGNRALRRVLVAYLVFNVAEWANWIALLIWAYDRDGVRGSSLVALAQLVPAAVLAASMARWSARMPPVRAITVGYAVQAACVLATGVALVASAPYAVVVVLAAAASVAITMTRPVHNVLLPELSDTTPELTAANTVSGSLEALAAFLGPLVSAGLIVVWGPGGVFLTMGASLAFGAVLTAGLRPRTSASQRSARDLGARPVSVREVLANRTARALTGLTAAEYVLLGMLDILLVALALDVLGMPDSGPGVLSSALGLGGLLGAAFTVVLVGRARLAPAVVVGAVAAGVPTALSGATDVPAVAFGLLAAAGAGRLFADVGARTLIQRALPDRMLAAVFGVQEATMMAGLAVGSLLAPVLVAAVGPRWSFAAAGLFMPLVVLASWRGLARADSASAVPPDVYALLRGVPFLAVLPPRVVERLALEAVRARWPAGTVAIQEGDPGDRFHVLADGTAEVSSAGRYVRTIGVGGWFGELALLRDVPRTATVTLTEGSELVSLGRVPFLTAVTGIDRSVSVAEEHAAGYDQPPD